MSQEETRGSGPTVKRESSFLVMVTGQIETVEVPSVPNVYCKYCYVYGPDWRQVGGIEEGISPTGHSPQRGNRITLNTPIEATFLSTNPFKWPQIVLSFYGLDAFGHDVVRGYSATQIPTVPGSTRRRCPIFLPQASTTLQRLIGLFSGRRPEFVDPRIVAMAESRDVTRVKTHGFVEISFTALLRDTKKFGYDVCAQTTIKFSEFPLDWPPDNAGASPSTEQGIESLKKAEEKTFLETLHEIEEEESAQQRHPPQSQVVQVSSGEAEQIHT